MESIEKNCIIESPGIMRITPTKHSLLFEIGLAYILGIDEDKGGYLISFNPGKIQVFKSEKEIEEYKLSTLFSKQKFNSEHIEKILENEQMGLVSRLKNHYESNFFQFFRMPKKINLGNGYDKMVKPPIIEEKRVTLFRSINRHLDHSLSFIPGDFIYFDSGYVLLKK